MLKGVQAEPPCIRSKNIQNIPCCLFAGNWFCTSTQIQLSVTRTTSTDGTTVIDETAFFVTSVNCLAEKRWLTSTRW